MKELDGKVRDHKFVTVYSEGDMNACAEISLIFGS